MKTFIILASLLVATPCVFGLTADEAAQFSGDGCTPEQGYTGAQVSASVSGGTTTISANLVPNHEWESVNPNTPSASSTTYTFTTPSIVAGTVYCLPQGPIGIAKNGVLLFNPTTSSGGNAKDDEEMDCNGGHSDESGRYHYHYLPDNGVVYDSSNSASQFVGVAFDGLPIYSTGDGIDVSDLDECHGLYVDGSYRYIASENHFPYFLGCYKASPQEGLGGSADCSSLTSGAVCTCELGVVQYDKKRALLDLLEEVFSSSKRTSPKLSWMNKRISCGGTCGAPGTDTSSTNTSGTSTSGTSTSGTSTSGKQRPSGRPRSNGNVEFLRSLLHVIEAAEEFKN